MTLPIEERLRRKRARAKLHYHKNREYYLARSRKRQAERENDPAEAKRFLDYKRRRAGLPEPTRPCPEYCEICLRPNTKKALALDHDHTTGAFRGWLCNSCNLGLGMLGDSPVALTAALNYLMAVK